MWNKRSTQDTPKFSTVTEFCILDIFTFSMHILYRPVAGLILIPKKQDGGALWGALNPCLQASFVYTAVTCVCNRHFSPLHSGTRRDKIQENEKNESVLNSEKMFLFYNSHIEVSRKNNCVTWYWSEHLQSEHEILVQIFVLRVF